MKGGGEAVGKKAAAECAKYHSKPTFRVKKTHVASKTKEMLKGEKRRSLCSKAYLMVRLKMGSGHESGNDWLNDEAKTREGTSPRERWRIV